MIYATRFPDTAHTRRESLRASGVVLGYLVIAYLLTGWQLPRILHSTPDYNFYVVQPLVWSGLALLGYRSWRRLADRPHSSRVLTGISFAIGAFSVSVLVVAGVIVGFAESPIAGRIVNYPKNGLFIFTLLLGIETARAFLYWAWRPVSEGFAFIATTLIFFAVAVPATQWEVIDGADSFLRIVMGYWLPALALSALATWLVEFGGLGPSFGYRIVMVAFIWFSPRLPALEWPTLMLVGTITPLLSAWLVRGIYNATVEGDAVRSGLPGSPDS